MVNRKKFLTFNIILLMLSAWSFNPLRAMDAAEEQPAQVEEVEEEGNGNPEGDAQEDAAIAGQEVMDGWFADTLAAPLDELTGLLDQHAEEIEQQKYLLQLALQRLLPRMPELAVPSLVQALEARPGFDAQLEPILVQLEHLIQHNPLNRRLQLTILNRVVMRFMKYRPEVFLPHVLQKLNAVAQANLLRVLTHIGNGSVQSANSVYAQSILAALVRIYPQSTEEEMRAGALAPDRLLEPTLNLRLLEEAVVAGLPWYQRYPLATVAATVGACTAIMLLVKAVSRR